MRELLTLKLSSAIQKDDFQSDGQQEELYSLSGMIYRIRERIGMPVRHEDHLVAAVKTARNEEDMGCGEKKSWTVRELWQTHFVMDQTEL